MVKYHCLKCGSGRVTLSLSPDTKKVAKCGECGAERDYWFHDPDYLYFHPISGNPIVPRLIKDKVRSSGETAK